MVGEMVGRSDGDGGQMSNLLNIGQVVGRRNCWSGKLRSGN